MEIAFKDFLKKLVYEKKYRPIYDGLEEAARLGSDEAYFYDEDCQSAMEIAAKEGLLFENVETTLEPHVRVWGWNINDA